MYCVLEHISVATNRYNSENNEKNGQESQAVSSETFWKVMHPTM